MEYTYSNSLCEFIHRTYTEAKKVKKQVLEDKLNSNYQVVTNEEGMRKRWKKGEAEGWRSDTFIGKVRAKVWTLYSVFLDTVMLGGQVPFTLLPSPYGGADDDPEVDRRVAIMSDRIKEQQRSRPS